MFLLSLLLCFAVGGAVVPRQTVATEAGYVVDETAGVAWEAVDAQGAVRPLVRGSRVLPGDTLRMKSGASTTSDGFLSVLLFSTGRVVKVASGAKVDVSAPTKPGALQRLIAAIARRLDNEALVPGIVRSASAVPDSVVVGSGNLEWRALVTGLDAGGYIGRFRSLGPDGRPAGAWTSAERFEIAPTGISPAKTLATLQPGVWQLSVRHERVPSVSGEGWILVSPDASAKEAFDLVKMAMEESLRTEGLEVNAATVRVRRAAILALAERR